MKQHHNGMLALQAVGLLAVPQCGPLASFVVIAVTEVLPTMIPERCCLNYVILRVKEGTTRKTQ